jgi:hypothetical protein
MNKFSQTSIFIFLIILSVSACKKNTKEETDTWGKNYTGNYLFTTVNIDMQTLLSDTTIFYGTISVQSKPCLNIEFLANNIIYPMVDDSGVLTIPGYGGGHDSFTGEFDSVGKVEFEFHHYNFTTKVKGVRK